jgi:hypothetical protein
MAIPIDPHLAGLVLILFFQQSLQLAAVAVALD